MRDSLKNIKYRLKELDSLNETIIQINKLKKSVECKYREYLNNKEYVPPDFSFPYDKCVENIRSEMERLVMSLFEKTKDEMLKG